MITIPEEFADLDISDVRPEEYKRRGRRKKMIRNRTNKDMTNYDAWRNHDRRVFVADSKHETDAVLKVAPADLVKVFGMPDEPSFGVESTGEYLFEDNNLDMFFLFDYKQTDLYHGLNREDEYYTNPKNMRLPLHRRKRKWPSIKEFWESEDPMPFRLIVDDQADILKFKRWFKAQMKKAAVMTESFDEKCMAKHGPSIDICLGDYNQKGVPNTDMAVFKLDWTMFMTK